MRERETRPGTILSPHCALGAKLTSTLRTPAAHFANGTVVNLARVPAAPEYTALMQHLVRSPETPYWLNRFSRVGYWLIL